MKKMTVTMMIGALLLSACASSPGSIAPTSMGNAFASLSCGEANQMLVTEQNNLVALTKAQNTAVAVDAIGVLFVLVPVSSLTGGDREGDIAASKGKVVALQARLASC